MLYYDPFAVEEEEEFLESERTESRQQVQQWIQRLRLIMMTEMEIELRIPSSLSSFLVEIRLTLPLEQTSLQSLVQAIITTTNTRKRHPLERLSLSHWGLGDEGITTLLPMLSQESSCSSRIKHLALTSCGITAHGFCQLLEALVVSETSTTLQSLDISRNNLLLQHSRPVQEVMTNTATTPKTLLHYALTQLLPRAAAASSLLSTLNLSATGLHSKELLHFVWQGVAVSSSLRSLDVSHNMDSLEQLLESLLFREKEEDDTLLSPLATLPLVSLTLTRGASSSTCLDYSSTAVPLLLERLVKTIATISNSSTNSNNRLEQLGPLSMLPLDRNSSPPALQLVHAYCTRLMDEDLQFLLQRNAVRQRFVMPLYYNKQKEQTSTILRNGNDIRSRTASSSSSSQPATASIATLPMVLEALLLESSPSSPSGVLSTKDPPHRLPQHLSYSLVHWMLKEASSHWAI